VIDAALYTMVGNIQRSLLFQPPERENAIVFAKSAIVLYDIMIACSAIINYRRSVISFAGLLATAKRIHPIAVLGAMRRTFNKSFVGPLCQIAQKRCDASSFLAKKTVALQKGYHDSTKRIAFS
jgi:hypothetical protein